MSKPAPIDWNGLLQWSSQYHDGTRPASDFKPLSGEDKKFLEGAMAQAFGEVEDYNELMQDAINKISTDFDNSDTVYTALEVVDKCCDNLDVPRNLHLFGGMRISRPPLAFALLSFATFDGRVLGQSFPAR